MISFLRRYKDPLLLLALLVLSLSLLLSNLRQKPVLNFAERSVIALFAPFQDATGWVAVSVGDFGDNYLFLVDTHRKNTELTKEVQRLTSETNSLREKLKFYQRLEELLAFENPTSYPVEVVRIIARDTTGRSRSVTINKGSDQGLRVNMPIITRAGVVGRIVTVTGKASKALLITDIRFAVDALLQESRERLIVGGANEELLDVNYLAVTARVAKGDTVISSGLGGIFPKGLVIGTIAEVKTKPNQLFLEAKIRPAVQLATLEEALALKTPQRPEAGAKTP